MFTLLGRAAYDEAHVSCSTTCGSSVRPASAPSIGTEDAGGTSSSRSAVTASPSRRCFRRGNPPVQHGQPVRERRSRSTSSSRRGFRRVSANGHIGMDRTPPTPAPTVGRARPTLHCARRDFRRRTGRLPTDGLHTARDRLDLNTSDVYARTSNDILRYGGVHGSVGRQGRGDHRKGPRARSRHRRSVPA